MSPGQGHLGAGVVCVDHGSSGRFLIAFGGRQEQRDEELRTNSIIVYDLENVASQPQLSAIRCPAKGEFHALVMRSASRAQELAFGFVNQSFKSSEMKGVQMLPRSLVQLIVDWVDAKAVHLLQKVGNGRWRVDVDRILSSVLM